MGTQIKRWINFYYKTIFVILLGYSFLSPIVLARPEEYSSLYLEHVADVLVNKKVALIVPKNALILKHADTANYDKNKQILHVNGHIIAYYDNSKLLTSQLIYNQKLDRIKLDKPFTYITTQQVIKANHGVIYPKKKNYTLYKVQRVFDQYNLQLSKKVVKKGIIVESFDSAITYCNLCIYDPNGDKPIPQYKVYHMIHNTDTDQYFLYNSFVNMYDVPFFYLPYLSFYGSSVKRKSGFLFPQFGFGSVSGTYFGTPYFVNLSDTQDLFVTPVYFSNAGLLLKSTYGIGFSNTYASLDGSYIHTNDQLAYNNDNNRWVLYGQSKSYFPYNTEFQTSVSKVSDAAVFSDFPVFNNAGVASNTSYSKSYIQLVQSTITENILLAGDYYQSLDNEKIQSTGDINFNAQYYFDSLLGGELELVAQDFSLFLTQNRMSHFAYVSTQYNKTNRLGPFLWSNGANIYAEEIFFNQFNSQNKLINKNFYDTYINVTSTFSLPFYLDTLSVGSWVYGPKIYGVYYLVPKKSPYIPLEYSMPLNIDETIFYSDNPTYSANILSNKRIDVGWETNWDQPEWFNLNAFLGRSIFLEKFTNLTLSPAVRSTPYIGDVTIRHWPMEIENIATFNSVTHRFDAYKQILTYAISEFMTFQFFYFSGQVSNYNTNESVFQRQIGTNFSYNITKLWAINYGNSASLIQSRVFDQTLSIVYTLQNCFSIGFYTDYSPLNVNKFQLSFQISIAPFFTYGNNVDNLGNLSNFNSNRF